MKHSLENNKEEQYVYEAKGNSITYRMIGDNSWIEIYHDNIPRPEVARIGREELKTILKYSYKGKEILNYIEELENENRKLNSKVKFLKEKLEDNENE